MWSWPHTSAKLVEMQRALAQEAPAGWTPPTGDFLAGGCFVCFPRGRTGPGDQGDPAWAGAVLMRGRHRVAQHVTTDIAGAPYESGLLALRMGAVLDRVVRGLPERPDVLLVDATGLDHPRRAGMTLHLGAVLDLPTVGLTHRPLLAAGATPANHAGATSPLLIDGEVVGYWLRMRAGVRPLAVHAGWRVDAAAAVDVVRRCSFTWRTPEPLREARRVARTARDCARGSDISP
jgi:deoxyribonuclease V